MMPIAAMRLRNGVYVPPPASVTWDPANKAGDLTLSGGNLIVTKIVGNNYASVVATRGVASSDSGYFEVRITEASSSPYLLIGIGNDTVPLNIGCGEDANGWAYYQETGQKQHNNVVNTFGATYTNGDVIGVAFKAGKVWFSKNGTYQGGGNPAAGTSPTYSGIAGNLFPMVSLYRGDSPAHVVAGRFKAADFSYAPPAGFAAWGG